MIVFYPFPNKQYRIQGSPTAGLGMLDLAPNMLMVPGMTYTAGNYKEDKQRRKLGIVWLREIGRFNVLDLVHDRGWTGDLIQAFKCIFLVQKKRMDFDPCYQREVGILKDEKAEY